MNQSAQQQQHTHTQFLVKNEEIISTKMVKRAEAGTILRRPAAMLLLLQSREIRAITATLSWQIYTMQPWVCLAEHVLNRHTEDCTQGNSSQKNEGVQLDFLLSLEAHITS